MARRPRRTVKRGRRRGLQGRARLRAPLHHAPRRPLRCFPDLHLQPGRDPRRRRPCQSPAIHDTWPPKAGRSRPPHSPLTRPSATSRTSRRPNIALRPCGPTSEWGRPCNVPLIQPRRRQDCPHIQGVLYPSFWDFPPDVSGMPGIPATPFCAFPLCPEAELR